MKTPSDTTPKRPYMHFIYLVSWVVYFALYFLTERFIPAENCYSVHIFLDDWIPFCEYFVIPYVLWYLWLIATVVYLLVRNIPGFCRFQTYIIITQILAFSAYILFPTRQDLRPDAFPRENILSTLVKGIYQADTNTGVCPSLHVAYAIGMASAWSKEHVSQVWKSIAQIMMVLICLSTVFIKQHSALDFFMALPVCLIAEHMAYRRCKKSGSYSRIL